VVAKTQTFDCFLIIRIYCLMEPASDFRMILFHSLPFVDSVICCCWMDYKIVFLMSCANTFLIFAFSLGCLHSGRIYRCYLETSFQFFFKQLLWILHTHFFNLWNNTKLSDSNRQTSCLYKWNVPYALWNGKDFITILLL
jgi:hypothetical protein